MCAAACTLILLLSGCAHMLDGKAVSSFADPFRVGGLQAVETGHLDIEKDDVWFGGVDLLQSFDTVGGGAADFDIWEAGEQILKLVARQAFVVYDKCGNRRHAATLHEVLV